MSDYGLFQAQKLEAGADVQCRAPVRNSSTLWVVVHLGLSSPGTYTLEVPHSLGRLVRWMYVAWVCVKQTPMPVLAFALIAALVGYRNRASQKRGIILSLAVLVTCTWLAILVAAHGIGHRGMPNPELFISASEATLLVGLTFFYLLSECNRR